MIELGLKSALGSAVCQQYTHTHKTQNTVDSTASQETNRVKHFCDAMRKNRSGILIWALASRLTRARKSTHSLPRMQCWFFFSLSSKLRSGIELEMSSNRDSPQKKTFRSARAAAAPKRCENIPKRLHAIGNGSVKSHWVELVFKSTLTSNWYWFREQSNNSIECLYAKCKYNLNFKQIRTNN